MKFFIDLGRGVLFEAVVRADLVITQLQNSKSFDLKLLKSSLLVVCRGTPLVTLGSTVHSLAITMAIHDRVYPGIPGQ